MAQIRVLLAWLVISCGSFFAPAAEAAVICSFSGSGSSGTDCLGHAWNVGNGGWGIPGVGLGTVAYKGTQTATDFHFRCLTGCGPILNSAGDITLLLVSPFSPNAWNEPLNAAADTIDFTSPAGSVDDLTTGKFFFVDITTAIDLRNFSFEASWTNDAAAVPEPSSVALLGLALAGLGLSRRRSKA